MTSALEGGGVGSKSDKRKDLVMTRGEGVQNPEILADVICARPPRTSRQKPETPKNEVLGLIETPMSSNQRSLLSFICVDFGPAGPGLPLPCEL